MRNPLIRMRIREQRINHTFGIVRNNNTKPHQGWDLEAPIGTSVHAISRGTIEFVESRGAYGLQIALAFKYHGRDLFAFYAHLLTANVVAGEYVEEGQIIGLTGASGNASKLPPGQEHLHFEIREGKARHGKGLAGRIDPGYILGFSHYASQM